MTRIHQVVLIVSTLLASWLAMQAVHELGHVVGAWVTGAEVQRVVLHPLAISRTDLGKDPHPLVVVWAGPIFGVLLPLVLWALAVGVRMPGTFVLRFFAGFCLIANGAYLAGGSFGAIGDCGVMLRHGAAMWQLWLFGAITIPLGLRLWHRQGVNFGLGAADVKVHVAVVYLVLFALCLLLVLGLFVATD